MANDYGWLIKELRYEADKLPNKFSYNDELFQTLYDAADAIEALTADTSRMLKSGTPFDHVIAELRTAQEKLKDAYNSMSLAQARLTEVLLMAGSDEGIIGMSGTQYWVCDPEKNTKCSWREKFTTCGTCRLTVNKEFRWIPQDEDNK